MQRQWSNWSNAILKKDHRLLMMGGATALLVLLSFIPVLGFIVYPLKIFVTYIHELSHAVMALLTGGSVHAIKIHTDTSGETLSSGGWFWLISSAGYVGTVLVGVTCLKMIMLNRSPKHVMLFFIGVMLASLYFIGFQSLFGLSFGMGLVSIFGWLWYKASPKLLSFIVSFMSIQLVCGAFYDLKVLFALSGTSVATDAMNMQIATGIPSFFWAGLWTVGSLFLAYFILFFKRKGS